MNMLVNEDGRLWPRVVAAATPAGVSLTISIAAFAIMFWSESKTVDAKTADAITRIERRIDTVENEAREARRAAAEDRQKIAEMMAELYPRLGDWLKQHWSGWNAFFFTADLRLAKLIRLSASRRTPLFNGALECRLFAYKMVAGGNRKA